MTTQADQPAFPAATATPDQYRRWAGLTKREWFAGMALQGLLACPGVSLGESAELAVKATDALLVALDKPTE